MNCCKREITIEGALADPLIRAVMAADGVDPRKLKEMLRKVGDSLRPQ